MGRALWKGKTYSIKNHAAVSLLTLFICHDPIRCGTCSQLLLSDIALIGCQSSNGGCGKVFHGTCARPGGEPMSTEDIDGWRCAECKDGVEDGVGGMKDEDREGATSGDEGAGIPSDESDDWDENCGTCGLDHGSLLCCDGCPGGEFFFGRLP